MAHDQDANFINGLHLHRILPFGGNGLSFGLVNQSYFLAFILIFSFVKLIGDFIFLLNELRAQAMK